MTREQLKRAMDLKHRLDFLGNEVWKLQELRRNSLPSPEISCCVSFYSSQIPNFHIRVPDKIISDFLDKMLESKQKELDKIQSEFEAL